MFEKKVAEMAEKAHFVEALGDIYDSLVDRCNWECRRYNQPDETHEHPYFTEYEEDEMSYYQKARYKAYKAVFKEIEKLAQ